MLFSQTYSHQPEARPDSSRPEGVATNKRCFHEKGSSFLLHLFYSVTRVRRRRRRLEGEGQEEGTPERFDGDFAVRPSDSQRSADLRRRMGQAFRKLFDAFFGNSEMRVVMLGLDAAGKTTILYKLHIGEVLSTVPTIGFNVEKVQYKNVLFTVWDVGGQEKLRPLWRHYFNNTDGLIYVVDSLDRERIGKAKAEFQAIINDPFMLNSVILVFANKQDMKGAMTPMEVCEGLGLYDLKNRMWHIQGSCALKGDGLYEGLDWLSSTLKDLQASGRLPSGGT
ncbi:hypothetical protein ZWY2020_021798 [Hordeum vulgare]|uniref:ADP-ribosylation factor n=2 Tax=Hordeum vulgare subsp. vulgare TaxID=112509 RepID=A0A8I7BC93_HORVV|nr:hypothetical protein ZWY2020_021798 [Hordeum vulgare]